MGWPPGRWTQLPAIVDATVQPATAILGTPVRDVIVTDPDGRVLYRRPAAARLLPRRRPWRPDPSTPVEEDRVRFAAPVLLRPLAFSTSAPAHGGWVEVDVELSVAVAQAQWQRRLLRIWGWSC
jgi:hypothetical protein